MNTLIASIERFTWSGNLTIAFNKPIIVPPIQVYNATSEKETEKNRSLQIYEQDLNSDDKLSIKDVLTIEVDSAFLESDDGQTSNNNLVKDYKLMRITPTSMDVKIDFDLTQEVPQRKAEPEILVVKFKNTDVFLGQKDMSILFEDSIELPFDFSR